MTGCAKRCSTPANGRRCDAPLAWLRMEPGDDPAEAAELKLRVWPGDDEQLLALTGYHGHPVWRP